MLANHAPASNDSPHGDSDYDIILAALMETARGRSFLAEYARRNRSPDTATLLSAIARIENLLTSRSLEPGEPAPRHAGLPAAPIEQSPPIPETVEIAVSAIKAVDIPGLETTATEVEFALSEGGAERDPFADIRALSDLEKIALFA
jgi:hypothetical protein